MSVTGSEKTDGRQSSDGQGWFSARLSEDDVAELTQNLAVLAAAGLPLDTGLAALADELPRGKLRGTLAEMSASLSRGEALDEVVAAQQDRLPPHVRGLVLAGVRSGRLAETLEQYVNHRQLVADLHRRVWSALAYPLLVLGFALAVFVFVEFAIVRHFVDIFADFELNLPVVTLLVIRASESLLWVALGGLIGLLVLWIVSRMTLSGPLQRRLVCRIPMFGPLWRFSALARFSNLAALLLESGIPWPTTLRWSSAAAGDVDLADACHRLARETEAGQTLAASEICHTRLPAGMGQMLAWGEARNALPEALRTAAEMYEGRAEIQTSFLVVVAPAIALVATITIVGFLAAALLMPLLQLIESLG